MVPSEHAVFSCRGLCRGTGLMCCVLMQSSVLWYRVNTLCSLAEVCAVVPGYRVVFSCRGLCRGTGLRCCVLMQRSVPWYRVNVLCL